MPLDSRIVGRSSKRFRHAVDARWIMAYAAGLGDWNSRYFDTTSRIVAHPVFPVCVEWPVVLDVRNIEGAGRMTPEEGARGVHATHDLHIHRPVTTGDELFTQASIIGVEQRKPGGYQMMCLRTTDSDGAPVATTFQGGLNRGVEVAGGNKWTDAAPALPEPVDAPELNERFDIPVRAEAAHAYTECARIFNPIHTDRQVALDANLPDIILHGTATLALAVTALIDHKLDADPTRVARVACRFSAMVLMPSTITLRVDAADDCGIWFTVLNAQGDPAVSGGYVGTRAPA